MLQLVADDLHGTTAGELARQYKISETTVWAHLKRQAAPRRPYRKVHGELAERVVHLYVDQGLSLRVVAAEVGVGREAVRLALIEHGVGLGGREER